MDSIRFGLHDLTSIDDADVLGGVLMEALGDLCQRGLIDRGNVSIGYDEHGEPLAVDVWWEGAAGGEVREALIAARRHR